MWTYMLINKHNRDILPLARETGKSALDGSGFGFGVDDEVVFLRVGGVGYVLAVSRISTKLFGRRGGV